MSVTDSLYRALVASAAEAGENERLLFSASKGPWFGFNGIHCYLVTQSSLWRGRAPFTALFGAAPEVTRWSLESCRASADGSRGLTLTTPQGRSTLQLASAAQARAAVAALTS